MLFADEEVTSTHGYLSGYKPRCVAEQIATLQGLFPNLGMPDTELAKRPPPDGAEGWFVIPRWEMFASTYGEAVEKALATISQTRRCKNLLATELGPRYLRQSAKTAAAFEALAIEQKNRSVVMVAAQFGLRHRGRSARRAREVMQPNECGLGAFAASIMLLTHPQRLMHYDDLYLICAGDEYDPAGILSSADVPSFRFGNDQLDFDCDWFAACGPGYGPATAFLV